MSQKIDFVVCDYEAGPCIYRDSTDLRERCVAHGALWSHVVQAYSREEARSIIGRPFKALHRPKPSDLFGRR
jgi:hypothetical protein